MKIRAIIFDIYGTLLEVGPPRPDAPVRWTLMWEDKLKTGPRLTLDEFGAACQEAIQREHRAERARGILHPEVYWPDIVSSVLPEFAHLSEAERSEFRFYHAQMAHTVRLMPGAAEALRGLRRASLRLGLASNSQLYTLRELDTALAGADLSKNLFSPTLCFFSFEHGFSKPDPHVFRMLTVRLQMLGIGPEDILMVGDRLDHDIEPARVAGWQTWRLRNTEPTENLPGGSWSELKEWLRRSAAP
jgi:putative hydrolase of the HAD superfamily